MDPDAGPFEVQIAGKFSEPGNPRRRREQESDDDQRDPEQDEAAANRIHGES